jgi:Zn-finger nucleic acid-binding protein
LSDPSVQCPVCKLDQVIVEWDDVELDVCVDGHGIWFDADELRQLFAAAGAPDALLSLEARLDALDASEQERSLACPRCGAAMQPVQVSAGAAGPMLDRCPHGHGLWFGEGELARLVEFELDTDDASLASVRGHLMRFIRPMRREEEHAT